MEPSLLLIIMNQNPEEEQRGEASYVCGQVGATSTLVITQKTSKLQNHFKTKTAVSLLKRLNILTYIF